MESDSTPAIRFVVKLALVSLILGGISVFFWIYNQGPDTQFVVGEIVALDVTGIAVANRHGDVTAVFTTGSTTIKQKKDETDVVLTIGQFVQINAIKRADASLEARTVRLMRPPHEADANRPKQ